MSWNEVHGVHSTTASTANPSKVALGVEVFELNCKQSHPIITMERIYNNIQRGREFTDFIHHGYWWVVICGSKRCHVNGACNHLKPPMEKPLFPFLFLTTWDIHKPTPMSVN